MTKVERWAFPLVIISVIIETAALLAHVGPSRVVLIGLGAQYLVVGVALVAALRRRRYP